MVTPIASKIVNEYPDAIIYDLRVLVKSNAQIQKDPEILGNLYEPFMQSGIHKFLEIIEYACEPERYLCRHLNELIHNQLTHEDLKLEINALMNKV